MKRFIFALLFSATLLLSACQTVPTLTLHQGFSPLPTNQNGRVLINQFRIPKSEPGVLAFYLFGGGNNVPYYASLYDVTDGVSYIGNLYGGGLGRLLMVSPEWYDYMEGWIEYDAPVGKRTLMLIQDAGFSVSTAHVDFIEVMVEPNKVSHISLSRYGFTRSNYLGELLLDEKHRAFCSNIAVDDKQKIYDVITQHMMASGIDLKARDFANYCLALHQQKQVTTPTEAPLKRFASEKSAIEAKMKSAYQEWKKQPEKSPTYDLMYLYQDTVVAEPNFMTGLGSNKVNIPIPPNISKTVAFEPIKGVLDVVTFKNSAPDSIVELNRLLSVSLIKELRKTCVQEVNGLSTANKAPLAPSATDVSYMLVVKPDSNLENSSDSSNSAKLNVTLHKLTEKYPNPMTENVAWKVEKPIAVDATSTSKATLNELAVDVVKQMTKDQLITTSCQ